MTEFARWHKWFCRERGHKPDAWDAWHGALQYIKEARPTVRKAVQQRKACNNADKVQCLGCGEWFINIDGCPNGCLAGVTTAIA
jgi:hypothetical protein